MRFTRPVQPYKLVSNEELGSWRDYGRFFSFIFMIALLANLLPVAYGHPLIVSDNLTQNNPLRYLVAQSYLHGHLPSWNPFSWTGTPLAAGFNSGAFYPLIFLYLIFPPDIALGVFQAILEAVFALGMYQLFRNLGFERRPSRIIAAISPFVGYYAAQSVHLDMVGGLAMLPYLTLALIKGLRATSVAVSARYGLLFGIAYALVVLGGAPEAMIYEAIFMAVFGILELVYLRPKAKLISVFFGVGAIAALLLPEVQILPGLLFINASQRGALPFDYATAGPFYPTSFLSLVTPFLFGGPGGFTEPNYFGPYGFEEVTIYIGIVPLILAMTTLAGLFGANKSLVRATDLPHRRTIIHLVIAGVASTILALGSFTPFEQLMLYVPIYNKQRLPSRNIFGFDFVALILAVPALGSLLRYSHRDKFAWRSAWITFSAVVIATLALLVFNGNLVRILDGLASDYKNPTEIAISSLVQMTLVVSVLLVIWYRPRITISSTQIALTLILVIDVISFNFQAYYASAPTTSVTEAKTSQALALKDVMKNNGGRFGIFDPDLFYYGELLLVGTPNLNLFNEISSIGGYSSLSLGNYNAATKSHIQASFDPSLLYSPLGKQLELTTILTGPVYFGTRTPLGDTATAIQPPISMSTNGTSKTVAHVGDFTGSPITASSIVLSFYSPHAATKTFRSDPNLGIASIKELSVVPINSDHRVRATLQGPVKTQVPNVLAYKFSLPRAITFGQILATQVMPAGIKDPTYAIAAGITIPQQNYNISLDGTLSNYLTPMLYHITTKIGTLTVYTKNEISSEIKALAAQTPSPPIVRGATPIDITGAKLTLDGMISYRVSSVRATTLTVSETYTSGWRATITNASGISHSASVRACGIFVCFDIPSGSSQITLNYVTLRERDGAILSLVGLLFVATILIRTRKTRRLPRQ